jgi:hypothetical protein
MYEVDDQDAVVQFAELPLPSAGAPEPVVLADETSAVVAYYAPDRVDWARAPRAARCRRVDGPPDSGRKR